MARGAMREQMPVCAAWIDDLRFVFGAEYIDRIIRAGMRGEPVFFASENGHTVGTPVPVGDKVVLKDERTEPSIRVARDGRRHIFDEQPQSKLKGK